MFSIVTLVFYFCKDKCVSVQIWGCARSHATLDSFVHLLCQIFSCYIHIGDMCELSLGVYGRHIYTHFVLLFFVFAVSLIFFLKKIACSCCLEIFINLRNCDLIFIGKLKILNT